MVAEPVVAEPVVAEPVVVELAVAEPAVAEPVVAVLVVAVLEVVVLEVVVLEVVVRRYWLAPFPIPNGLGSNRVCWRFEKEVPIGWNPSLAMAAGPSAEQDRGQRRCQRQAR